MTHDWRALHPFKHGLRVWARRDVRRGRTEIVAGQGLTVSMIGCDETGLWFTPEGAPLLQLDVMDFTATRADAPVKDQG